MYVQTFRVPVSLFANLSSESKRKDLKSLNLNLNVGPYQVVKSGGPFIAIHIQRKEES
jgi:hypothetical protein